MMEKHVIEGPPGTGKSHALAGVWIPKAAARFGADRLVVCSLTRAAASEIAGRVAAKGIEIPRDQVGTLHSLLWRAAERPEILRPSHLAAWNALHSHLACSARVAAIREDVDEGAPLGALRGDALHALADLLRLRMVPPQEWPEDVAAFHERWQAWKASAHLAEFTDLPETALREGWPCPGHPAVLFVDEAQDYSRLEMALIDRWGASCDYYVVAGDPNQAIYTFRGADPTVMMEGATKVWPLPRSYRCPAPVVSFAEGLLRHARVAYPVAYEPAPHEGEMRGGDGLLYTARDLLARTTGSVMLLAPCHYQIPLRELRDLGLPFHNPYNPDDLATNPLGLRSNKGLGARLRNLLAPRFPELAGGGSHVRSWTWRELWSWAEYLEASGTLRRGAKVAIEKGAKSRSEQGRPLTPREFVDLFLDGSALAAHTPTDLLEWFCDRLLKTRADSFAYVSTLARRAPTELWREPRLIVGTIHGVKGGEADSVALYTGVSRSAWDESANDSDPLIRLMYVGATRARHVLCLVGAQGRDECALQRMGGRP